MYRCLVCVYERRWARSPDIWDPLKLQMVLSHLTQVLKTKARSSGRSAHALDSWATCLLILPMEARWCLILAWNQALYSGSKQSLSNTLPSYSSPQISAGRKEGESKRKTRKRKTSQTKEYGTKTQREIWVCVGVWVCGQVNCKVICWGHVEMQRKWKFSCTHGPWSKVLSSFSHIKRYMQISIRRGTIWISPWSAWRKCFLSGGGGSMVSEEWGRVAGQALHVSEDSGCYLYSQSHLSFNGHFQLLLISSALKDLNSTRSDHPFSCRIISVYLALENYLIPIGNSVWIKSLKIAFLHLCLIINVSVFF